LAPRQKKTKLCGQYHTSVEEGSKAGRGFFCKGKNRKNSGHSNTSLTEKMTGKNACVGRGPKVKTGIRGRKRLLVGAGGTSGAGRGGGVWLKRKNKTFFV